MKLIVTEKDSAAQQDRRDPRRQGRRQGARPRPPEGQVVPLRLRRRRRRGHRPARPRHGDRVPQHLPALEPQVPRRHDPASRTSPGSSTAAPPARSPRCARSPRAPTELVIATDYDREGELIGHEALEILRGDALKRHPRRQAARRRSARPAPPRTAPRRAPSRAGARRRPTATRTSRPCCRRPSSTGTSACATRRSRRRRSRPRSPSRPPSTSTSPRRRTRARTSTSSGAPCSRASCRWPPTATAPTTSRSGRVQTPTLRLVVDRELERRAFVPVPVLGDQGDARRATASRSRSRTPRAASTRCEAMETALGARPGRDGRGHRLQGRAAQGRAAGAVQHHGAHERRLGRRRVAGARHARRRVAVPRRPHQLPAHRQHGVPAVARPARQPARARRAGSRSPPPPRASPARTSSRPRAARSAPPTTRRSTRSACPRRSSAATRPRSTTSSRAASSPRCCRRPSSRASASTCASASEPFLARGSRVGVAGLPRGLREVRGQARPAAAAAAAGRRARGARPALGGQGDAAAGRYGQGTLIEKMEELGLGTKATRADIIQHLYDRNYVRDNPVEPTELGVALIAAFDAAMEKAPVDISSSAMTAELERQMDRISEGELRRDEVVAESQEMLEQAWKLLDGHVDDIRERIKSGVREDLTLGDVQELRRAAARAARQDRQALRRLRRQGGRGAAAPGRRGRASAARLRPDVPAAAARHHHAHRQGLRRVRLAGDQGRRRRRPRAPVGALHRHRLPEQREVPRRAAPRRRTPEREPLAPGARRRRSP